MANIFTLENFTDFSEKISIDELYEKKRQTDLNKLELLQVQWQLYVDCRLINNGMIKMPHAIAYRIREILATPIIKDEDGEENFWLTDVERKIVNNNKQSDKTPIVEDDHIIVCVRCKEQMMIEKEIEE